MKHSAKTLIYIMGTLVVGITLGIIFALYMRSDFLLELGNRFFTC